MSLEPIAEAEVEALAALRTYGRAKQAMEAHDGARRGPEFAPKVERWRRALIRLEAAAKALVELEVEEPA